jgi:LacI family transcriptional regulator
LNGTGQLRTETRERVLRAAADLGFSPHGLARGLSSGRSFTVGLDTTDSFGRFSLPVMFGVEDALGAEEMAVLLCDTRDDPTSGRICGGHVPRRWGRTRRRTAVRRVE